jgi:hydrogenase/urease accessory protein HupE
MINPVRPAAFATGFFLLAAAQPAWSHAPIEGLGGFYNGMLHPILVPSQLLLLIAAGMLFGQQGASANQPAIAAFAGATILGLITAWFIGEPGIEMIVLMIALIISVMVAASLRLSLTICAVILALAGFMLGIDSAQDALLGKDRFGSLLGSGISIYLIFLFVMGWADANHDRAWQKIGVRIIGSWIAASSLLMLAFSLSAR